MSIVSIVRVQNEKVENAVKKAISLTNSFESIPWNKSKVMIKPNTVNPSKSGSGVVTDARIIEAVTNLVSEKNPKRLVIGEGSSVGYDFPEYLDSMHCMEVAGVLEVADKLGVEVVDLNRDEQVGINVPEAYVMDNFAVAKTAWNSDVIIDLPVIKTHVRTGITCGLKNMKGVLPGQWKKRTHQLGLDKGIVDLNRAMKPTFTIVDGIVGREGTHTDESDKVPLGLILAGGDVVAVDTVCAAVAGFDVDEILHVQLAAEAGLGTANLNLIEVRGEGIEDVRRQFVPYLEAAQNLYGGAKIIEKGTCTGCMGEVVSLFIYLKEAGFEDRLSDLALIMGTPEGIPPLDKTPVVIGRCARKFSNLGVYVPGCPPHGTKITNAVCEAFKIDRNVVQSAIDNLHKS